MKISAETGIIHGFLETPVEGMLVMTDDEPGQWYAISFQAVSGFTYERGHEYELRVKRTIMANPPADGSDRYYELISIISDKLVAAPEIPIDDNIRSEADIEYYEDCPINKYSISSGYNVNEDGAITYADGSALPSYDTARIWLENVLDQADPNWVKYNKASYQATYSYVISPLSDKIRFVRNDSHGPMFKKVIPEDEFAHITQSMRSGEEVHYILILANVYKKGLQKLEFTIKKE